MRCYVTPEDFVRAEANGISADLLRQRVYVYGWPVEKAVTKPALVQHDRGHWVKQAEDIGVNANTFYRRVNVYGWSEERAATTPTISPSEKRNRGHEASRKYPKEYVALAVQNGISARRFRDRMSKGWSLEDAAMKPLMSPSEAGSVGRERQRTSGVQ